MRFCGLAAAIAAIAAATFSGCGYLPSELEKPGANKRGSHARVLAKQQTVSCDTQSRGFHQLTFNDIYVTTGDTDAPFAESAQLPAQYDVRAYVWGYDGCSKAGTCDGGDHYWLIERGPGSDFSTWVVTPQYPRITIQSTCSNRLKVGQRFRFSFSRGKLVGFSR